MKSQEGWKGEGVFFSRRGRSDNAKRLDASTQPKLQERRRHQFEQHLSGSEKGQCVAETQVSRKDEHNEKETGTVEVGVRTFHETLCGRQGGGCGGA
jgi:hypothetical protein